MTDSETETRQQEIERDSLQGVISQMQGALLFATAEARPALTTAMRNATSRLGVVEKKIQELHTARETEAKEQTNAAALAQSESRLNQEERNTFAGFLKEDFFTKADLGRLEDFYTKSWERLSESGKNQMSHRVWDGIRHGEYTFDQLPPAVREKEAKQAYGLLRDSKIDVSGVDEIPDKDRQDFIRAYEAGKKAEAGKILERESFKKAMFRGSESKSVTNVEAGKNRESESEQLLAAVKPAGPSSAGEKPKDSKAIGNADFSALQFGGMTAGETTASVQPPLVANAAPTTPRER
jgi:hypothetical protein